MSNLVIVAIPAEDDYIHQISSQKVPHMTLLFLGENSNEVKNLSKILDFVEHAAERSLCRFGMEVDRRGELGEAKADVLFFKKSKWSGFETVRDYRSYLLKNDNIRAAYDAAKDQFTEFIPHLTLGYPDAPAKPDKRDYPGTSYVNFDRIAVWVEDFDGPEFRLRDHEWDMEVAMSDVVDEVVDDILIHFGRKGMKWGVRKQQVHPSIAHIPKKTRKEASKDAEEFTRAKLFFGQGAGTRRKLIKAKVESKKAKDPLYAKAFDHFVKRTDLGQRASQAKNQRRRKDTAKSVKRTTKKVGRVLGPLLAGQQSYHSGLAYTDDILQHFGKKGMKWGVRNRRTLGPQAVTVRDKGKKIKTKGGGGHPSTESAIGARTIGQKGKKSGLKSLTDHELQIYAKRIQLEQNVSRLMFSEKSRGAQFVDKVLSRKGSQLADKAAQEGASKVGRSALNAATRKSIKVARIAAVV